MYSYVAGHLHNDPLTRVTIRYSSHYIRSSINWRFRTTRPVSLLVSICAPRRPVGKLQMCAWDRLASDDKDTAESGELLQLTAHLQGRPATARRPDSAEVARLIER